MGTVFKTSLIALFIITSVDAQDEKLRVGQEIKDELIQERNRAHSVRKVVQGISQLEEIEVSDVDARRDMFEVGTLSGQLKTMYAAHIIDNSDNTFATAVGATLKYELAKYKGFNAGAAFSTTHDVDFLSGTKQKHNYYLSTPKGSYTQLTEAFIHYEYKDLNLRAGRQVIDTPLADSDDVRMISNTFESYMARFEFNRWTFMVAKLEQWQGSDSWNGRNNEGWQNTGDKGAYLAGISLSKVLLDLNFWYYDFSKDTNADSTTGNIANTSIYLDASLHNKFGEDFFLHMNLQYLNQSESDNSTIESTIYGTLVEFIAYDFGVSVAYNKAQRKAGKGSFSGYGGGTLYTNMDNIIIDNISFDREVQALMMALSYTKERFGFLYAYGDFKGDADSLGQKEHIIEQNIGMQYQFSETFTLAAICVISEDKEDTDTNAYFNEGDFINYRVWVSYNF